MHPDSTTVAAPTSQESRKTLSTPTPAIVQLLQSIDLERQIAMLAQLGATEVEFYASRQTVARVRVDDRTHSISVTQETGLSVQCTRLEQRYRFLVDRFHPEAVEQCLLGTWSTKPVGIENPSHKEKDQPRVGALSQEESARLQSATHLGRGAFSFGKPSVLSPELLYEEVSTDYAVRKGNSDIVWGRQSEARFDATWEIAHAGVRKTYEWSLCSHFPERLMEQLKASNRLLQKVRSSMEPREKWPAPQGRMDVHLSRSCMARLIALFAKGFEGDKVLAGGNWLTQCELPLNIPLDLDRPEETGADAEGVPQTEVCFFKKGRPRALAVNRALAEEIGVAPNGFSFRSGFRSKPSIAIRNLRVRCPDTRSDLLRGMQKGLHVEDLRIESFSEANGEIVATLTDASLVHQGQLGEQVEPVRVLWNLKDTLESLIAFGQTRTHEGVLPQDETGAILDVETPDALFTSLPIAGHVPMRHYF